MTQPRFRIGRAAVLWAACVLAGSYSGLEAQEPAAWGPDLLFHTFSIAAVDPSTGESGVAVTTRVPCVGNGVPWVRAGVGAVATQASTRTAYGEELLDLLESGLNPTEAMAQATADDELLARRQVGVVAMDGTSAQHTGDGTNPWAGHRAGPNYATQGNLLVGPQVVEAVAAAFEASEGSGRHLADRLIEALAAGQTEGGDARKGRLQSAAVVVADPRDGRSRRADGKTANINVCEHPAPVAELRRIYETISGTLGFRTLEQNRGSDVWQVKLILHALGYYRADSAALERTDGWDFYDDEIVTAADAFREDQGLTNGAFGG
ncbi:MAG: DUF1028 domain-containing protein, partial [Longimicrobiales bacterium]